MISFIIPTHNYGHLLERCIKSICKNNAKYIKEIVIVNDASNDNTEHVVKKLKEKYLLLL